MTNKITALAALAFLLWGVPSHAQLGTGFGSASITGGGGSTGGIPGAQLCGSNASSFAGDYGGNVGLSCSAGTCTETTPLASGTAPGCMDVVVIDIIDNAPATANFSAPSGWNKDANFISWGGHSCGDDTSIDKQFLFWRIHQSGDSNPTFSWQPIGGVTSVTTYVTGSFKNVVAMDADPTCGASTTSGGATFNTMTTATAPGVTPTGAGDMWLGLWSNGGPQVSITPSFGTTGQFTNCGGIGCGGTNSALIYQPLTNANAIGSQTVSWPMGGYWGFGQALLKYGTVGLGICGISQVAYNGNMPSGGQAINSPSNCTATNGPVLLLLFASNRNGTSVGINTPAGFTAESSNSTGSVVQVNLFYEIIAQGASIPSSTTITTASTGGNFIAASYAIQGFKTTSPFDGTPSFQGLTTAGTSASTLGLTTTAAGDLIIELYSVNGADEGVSANLPSPNGIVESLIGHITSPGTGATGFMALSDWVQSSAGATGVDTYGTFANSVGSTSAPRVGMTVAIKHS